MHGCEIFKRKWARDGLDYRTFAQPSLELGCEPGINDRKSKNGRERAPINEPLRSPRLSSDVNRVLGVLQGIMGARGLGLTNLCAALA